MYTFDEEFQAYVAGERGRKDRDYQNNYPEKDLLRDHYDAGYDRQVFHPRAERTNK